jgi:hypothetical protein
MEINYQHTVPQLLVIDQKFYPAELIVNHYDSKVLFPPSFEVLCKFAGSKKVHQSNNLEIKIR